MLGPSVSFPGHDLCLLEGGSTGNLASSATSHGNNGSVVISRDHYDESYLGMSLFATLPGSSFITDAEHASTSVSFIPPAHLGHYSYAAHDDVFYASESELPVSSEGEIPPFTSSGAPAQA